MRFGGNKVLDGLKTIRITHYELILQVPQLMRELTLCNAHLRRAQAYAYFARIEGIAALCGLDYNRFEV